MKSFLLLVLFLSVSAVSAQVSHSETRALFYRNASYPALKKEFAALDKKGRVPVHYKEVMLQTAFEQGDTLYFKELLSELVAKHHFVLFPDYIHEPYFSLVFKGRLRDWYRGMWKKEIVKWYTHNGDILEWRMLILGYHERYNMVQRMPGRDVSAGDSSIKYLSERRDDLLREAAFRILSIAAANDSILPSDDNMGLGVSDAVDDILLDFILADTAGVYFDMVENLYWRAFEKDLAGDGFPRMYDFWLNRRKGLQYYGTIEKFIPLKNAGGLMDRRKRWKLD